MDVLHHTYAVTSAHSKVKLDEKVNKAKVFCFLLATSRKYSP